MFQTLGEILHVHPLIFTKILRRLREVNYLLKATQLESGRAKIRLRQSHSRSACLGTGSDAFQKEKGC